MNLLDGIDGGSTDGEDLPVALTIAGSDSGGGAGLQADIKTFSACGVFATTVVTLVTAQNTRGVDGIQMLDGDVIRSQYASVIGDLKPALAKTGALGNTSTISVVAEMIDDNPPGGLVVDPVMISKHGDELMSHRAYPAMREFMLPQADLVTPNRFEAAALIDGGRVETVNQMKEAARRILDFGAEHVVIKGGHFDNIVRDIYCDKSGFVEFGADRVDTDRLHGSGCVFSSAITARLAHGDSMVDAIGFARQFITTAIEHAPDVGGGVGPVNPQFDRR